jgi:hypothetical protein
VASYLRSFWATGARDSRALPGRGGIRGGIGGTAIPTAPRTWRSVDYSGRTARQLPGRWVWRPSAWRGRRPPQRRLTSANDHPDLSQRVPASLTRGFPTRLLENRCGMVEAGAGDGPSYALSRGADFAHPHPVVAHRRGSRGRGGSSACARRAIGSGDRLGVRFGWAESVSRELSTRESVRSRFVRVGAWDGHGCGAGCRCRVWSPTRLGIACDGRGSSTAMLGWRRGSARTCCKRGREPWGSQADAERSNRCIRTERVR